MKLTVVSHKECWRDPRSRTGYSTYGGFPLQMQAISEAFDETVVAVPCFPGPAPAGLLPLEGRNLSVLPLAASHGQEIAKKLALLRNLPRVLPELWRAIGDSDAVHAVVPGDIGTLGLAMALARKRPLFVRHCGRWGVRRTLTERYLLRTLERHAGGRNVVMATGGAPEPPSRANAAIEWIFSTSLREDEIRNVPQAEPWRPGIPLRLVTVGRLDPGKNVDATIDAVARLRGDFPGITFTVVGDGSCAADWKARAIEAGLGEVVDFVGRVDHDQVLAILARSHVFVFPTDTEGFPKALLEAMACGLPALATPVSVIPALLGGGAGGLLEDTTAGAIERALRTLLADPEGLQRMGAVARETSLGYTLERWRDLIFERCSRAWQTPTRTGK